MATFDAIAFLSDTLRVLLQNGLVGLVSPANVLHSTPSEFKDFAPTQPSVTLFLYHVAVCGDLRNSRSHSIGGLTVPTLPLELRYIITPWTQVPRDSYRIVGAIAQLFYQHSVLSFSELQGNVWAPNDTVELILESVPVEEHYDIWEPTEIPYRLSLTYLARLVGIDPRPSNAPSPVTVATFPGVGP